MSTYISFSLVISFDIDHYLIYTNSTLKGRRFNALHADQIIYLAFELLLIPFLIRLFRYLLYRLPEKLISWSVAHFLSVKVRTATNKLNVTLPKVPERYNAAINYLALG